MAQLGYATLKVGEINKEDLNKVIGRMLMLMELPVINLQSREMAAGVLMGLQYFLQVGKQYRRY